MSVHFTAACHSNVFVHQQNKSVFSDRRLCLRVHSALFEYIYLYMLDFNHPHGCRWAGAYSSCMETAGDGVQPASLWILKGNLNT